MRMRTKTTELTSMKGSSAPKDEGENEWEVRPGGMLVQKRDPDEEQNRIPPPTIRVRVKYRSICHEICINSQATFGNKVTYLLVILTYNCIDFFFIIWVLWVCYRRVEEDVDRTNRITSRRSKADVQR